MKIIFNLTAMLILSVILNQVSFARENGNGNVRVKGHITKRGSYITPHSRTRPDNSKRNNWSTKGNINPYTGKEGVKDPDKLPSKPTVAN